jgi:spore coat polysaccharide biosynthesis protein SpsF (cytidylyltransferase family)
MKPGIIIQARTGSTRLPQKITLPFYQDSTLLDIIIDRIKPLGYLIVLATSNRIEDQTLKKVAEKHKITFFAGDENNVLKRFIDCAEANDIDVIIRVCADNPFIQADYIDQLLKEYIKNERNYLSFFTDSGIPVIKTHYGFFSEVVQLNALKRISELTTDKLYLEHVTNFIYANPDKFSIGKLPLPFNERNEEIRLTIDTLEDFKLASSLYRKYKDLNPSDLIEKIITGQEFLNIMKEQIRVNSK